MLLFTKTPSSSYHLVDKLFLLRSYLVRPSAPSSSSSLTLMASLPFDWSSSRNIKALSTPNNLQLRLKSWMSDSQPLGNTRIELWLVLLDDAPLWSNLCRVHSFDPWCSCLFGKLPPRTPQLVSFSKLLKFFLSIWPPPPGKSSSPLPRSSSFDQNRHHAIQKFWDSIPIWMADSIGNKRIKPWFCAHGFACTKP